MRHEPLEKNFMLSSVTEAKIEVGGSIWPLPWSIKVEIGARSVRVNCFIIGNCYTMIQNNLSILNNINCTYVESL